MIDHSIETYRLPIDEPEIRSGLGLLSRSPTAQWAAVVAIVLRRHSGSRTIWVQADRCLASAASTADARTVDIDPARSFASLAAELEPLLDGASHGDLCVRSTLDGGGRDADRGSTAPTIAARLRLDAAEISVDYHPHDLDGRGAARFAHHLLTVLRHGAATPEASIGALTMERGELQPPAWTLGPAHWIAREAPEHTETLVSRFRATARDHLERIAVTAGAAALTYRQLDESSDVAADRIRQASPGRMVALLCPHDLSAVTGIWAALKAGAAYVPLDPRQPDSRLEAILEDAQASVVACDRSLRGRARQIAGSTPIVELGADVAHPVMTSPDADPPGPEDVAYLLHTSGTTGRPKAVVQTHRNVLTHALRYADRIRLSPGDRVPLLARYGFDAAVMDIFGSLLSGASLHLVEVGADGPTATDLLTTVAPTVLHCTPTLLRHLAATAHRTDPSEGPFRCVRLVVLGGEPATGGGVATVRRCFPTGTELVNGFGPTECTVALQHRATLDDESAHALPIGAPVPGVRATLIDEDGWPTEVFGELVLHSHLVAQGYWEQPVLTSAAFAADAEGTPTYRTGDLARKLPDDTFVHAGRTDDQVKIRGHRVEPGESESMLRHHPSVAEAIVVGESVEGSSVQLVAYVTSATNVAPNPADLLAYLARHLPSFAVPSRIEVIDEIPIGPTGKVDRARLPSVVATSTNDHRDLTSTEMAVAHGWERILGGSVSDPDQSFLDAGGDSLQLLLLMDFLADEFGLELDLGELLAASTISALAQRVDRPTG